MQQSTMRHCRSPGFKPATCTCVTQRDSTATRLTFALRHGGGQGCPGAHGARRANRPRTRTHRDECVELPQSVR